MKPIHSLLAPTLLLLSAVALAQKTPVLVNTTPVPNTQSNINLQTNTGSACATPPIGLCGTCSVTCPTGQTAMCKPGLAVNGQPGASCLTPPECKCQ
ncbi:MAG: hypothetical protein P4L83_18110 [Nevskia sp.]|nr:hypothetical protein [Nevskia sp.]